MQSLLCSSRKCFTFACMVHLLHYITSKEPIYLCKKGWKKNPLWCNRFRPLKKCRPCRCPLSKLPEDGAVLQCYWKAASATHRNLLIFLMLSYCTLKIENRFLWGLDRLPQESWFIHHHEWGYEAMCLRVPCVCVIDWFSCALLISYYT